MQKLKRVLVILLLLLITPELALQALDPLQVKPYFGDLDILFASMRDDPARGYVHTPGVYPLSYWTATILEDRTRLIPETRPSDCTLALVGDSATFGHGVNDDETWANLIARQFPSVHLLNAGVNGYNIQQVYATIQTVKADGYLYTLISNDADPVIWPRKPSAAKSMIEVYFYVFRTRVQRQPQSVPDYRLFDSTYADIKAREDVLTVGFQGDTLAARVNVDVLPYWTHNNSPTDSHANIQGNIEIAESVAPFVQRLVEKVC